MAILGLLVVSVVSAVLLGLQILSEDAAFHFSSIVYVIVPAGSGLVVMAAAMTREGRSRVAWFTIGAGVFAWGVGEIIWVLYEYVLNTEVPYPGWADFFYVAGYPLVFVGVMLLPHVKPHRLERIRLSMDALAGAIAVAAIMWVAYVGDQVYFDPEAGFVEHLVNVMYPLGDVFLLTAVVVLAVRRSSYRFDVRLFALAASLIFAAVADYIYILQVEADTYVSGGWLDAIWLIDSAAVIVAGLYLIKTVKPTEQVVRRSRIWQLGVPYAAIALLFGLTLWDSGSDLSVLRVASVVVALLIIGRQAVAIRENRELVERQRNDLIASVSHELRTPLTGVTGFSAVLNSEWETLDDDNKFEMVSIIDNQAQHLNRIVSDLVGLAHDGLQSTDLELDIVAIDEVPTDASVMVRELVDGEIELEIATEPGLWVFGDRGRLTQILVNLLTNAVRYGNGQIRLDTHAHDGHVVFEVHDSGPGVPKRHEEAIWERFDRGVHRLDATIPGSGIGLSIARSLAEAHGGTLTYQRSDVLGGACFTMSLPAPSTSANTAPQLTATPA
jgi:signal transduction histidine kinase